MVDAFDEYESAVMAYEKTWFISDPSARDALLQRPDARAKALALAAAGVGVGSDVVYQLQPGRWAPNRIALHDGLVDRVFETATSASPGLPIAVLMMGLPGSGKSSLLGVVARELLTRIGAGESASTDAVDADNIRELLPEYRSGLGSGVVQVECADLTYGKVVERAFRNQRHLILDSIGDPVHSVRDVEYLTQAGWSVVVLCSSVSVDLAVHRAKERALQNGRYVPPSFIRAVGGRPLEAFGATCQSGVPMVGACLFDTEVPLGEPPIVLNTTDTAVFGEVGAPTTLWPPTVPS